jgi:small subunit ribosomal protein S4
MGDPRRPRKKYETAIHPWIKEKIASEKILTKEYGLKTEKEILKAQSYLKKIRGQAKKLIRDKNKEQAKKEHRQLLQKLAKLGLCSENSPLEDLLALNVRNILDRRLQTLVLKQGYALTPNQARQLIVHGHITVNNVKMTVPSYLVLTTDLIDYKQNSTFASEEHSERQKLKDRNKVKSTEAEKNNIIEEKKENEEENKKVEKKTIKKPVKKEKVIEEKK